MDDPGVNLDLAKCDRWPKIPPFRPSTTSSSSGTSRTGDSRTVSLLFPVWLLSVSNLRAARVHRNPLRIRSFPVWQFPVRWTNLGSQVLDPVDYSCYSTSVTRGSHGDDPETGRFWIVLVTDLVDRCIFGGDKDLVCWCIMWRIKGWFGVIKCY